MEPKEFLLTASNLSKLATPAGNRSAISRTYYSLFHTAISFFEKVGITIKKGPGAHANVEKVLNNTGIDQLSKIGRKYQDLKSLRIKADYHLGDDGRNSEKNQTAETSINSTNKILEEIEKFSLSDDAKDQITKNVEEWKRITGNRL